MKLHEKINKLRKEKKLSQEEMGKKIGAHMSYISRLENGKSQPTADLLWKIAQTLGVSSDYLLDDSENELISTSVKDKSIAEKIRMIEQLEQEDQNTILNVIDAMLTKKRMKELLG